MKRIALLSVILSLVVSIAAPTGAAIALEEELVGNSTDVASEPEDLDGLSRDISTETSDTEAVTRLLDDAKIAEKDNEIDKPDVKEDSVDLPKDGSSSDDQTVYPSIVISELQVNGSCDGGDWCVGSNVEFIELYNPNSFNISLNGWKIQRQATGDNSLPTNHVVFGDIGIFAGEYALVSLGLVQPEEQILTTFTSALNNNEGSLILVAPDNSIVDIVGWGSKSKSYYSTPAQAPKANQSIQRCLKDGALFTASPRDNSVEMLIYEDIGPTPGAGIECTEQPTVNYCEGLKISEVAANLDEQFIELYNSSGEDLMLGGCKVQTNRSSEAFTFDDNAILEANNFVVVLIADTNLTLTKTTSGIVYVVSSDGLVEADTIDYSNLAKGTSWSLVSQLWLQTYTLTPGSENIYTQYPPCEDGYWRNLETGRCNRTIEPVMLADCGEGRERNPDSGRCRNIPSLSQLSPCREGQYRSEETNRCRSIAIAAATILKPCADGQFRNPATNRCKKIASTDDLALADCGEGRERNPATNRCRNVVVAGAMTDTLPFPVDRTESSREQFVGWWALGVVAIIGVSYGVWEWRQEIVQATKRAGKFITGSK